MPPVILELNLADGETQQIVHPDDPTKQCSVIYPGEYCTCGHVTIRWITDVEVEEPER